MERKESCYKGRVTKNWRCEWESAGVEEVQGKPNGWERAL